MQPVGVPTAPVRRPVSVLPLFGRAQTPREQDRLESLRRFEKMAWVEPLFDALGDQSLGVRKEAVAALRRMEAVPYGAAERRRYEKVKKLADEALKRYQNGKDIAGAVRDLDQDGYTVLYGSDVVPPRLFSKEALVDHGLSDDEAGEVRSGETVLRVRALFSKPGAAEFVARRNRSRGFILFADGKGKISPETFWHEYFHYLQYRNGLFGKTAWGMDVLFKREMEANQFILDRASRLKVGPKALMREIALWKHNFQGYRYVTMGSERMSGGRLDRSA